ncbi:MAG: hypothetical protein Q9222_003661 [Ikaeria aurantiellina]
MVVSSIIPAICPEHHLPCPNIFSPPRPSQSANGNSVHSFSYPSGQPPTPTRTPTSATFAQSFETPKQESSFYDPRVTWNTADPSAESPDFLRTPHFFNFSTPLRSPTKPTATKRPLSAQNLEDQIASHVHHLSPNPDQSLPPVEPSRRLTSSPNPSSTAKRPCHRSSQNDLTPLKTSLDEDATSSMRSAGSMQTPPPTSTSTSRRKAQQTQVAKMNKHSAATGRRMSSPGAGKLSETEATIPQIQTSPGFPSLQFSPDGFNLPFSGPATAPVLAHHKLYWDSEPNHDPMSLDFSANDAFALGIGIDKDMDPFTASQEQATPSRLPTTSFHAPNESRDDLALFPVSAKVPARKFANSRVKNHGVNPSLLFSSPGHSSELSNLAALQDGTDDTLQPYAHQIRDAEREHELLGPKKSKRKQDLEADSPAVKAALETLRDEVNDRPTIRRSVTDSVLQSIDDTQVKAALRDQKAMGIQKRISRENPHSSRHLSPYKSDQQARKSTRLTLTIDPSGRAKTEKQIVKAEAGPPSDSRMDVDSASETDDSSTSSGYDDIALSHHQSFAADKQKKRKAKLTRFALGSHTHSQRSSYTSTFTSNSTGSGNMLEKSRQNRRVSHLSSQFDHPSLLPSSDDHASSSTVVSDRLDGREGNKSDGETIIESDDGKGNAQSELKKMRQKRERSKPRQDGLASSGSRRGFEYPNPAAPNPLETFPYAMNPAPGQGLLDPFDISPTTITDPDLTTPNSARDSQVSSDCTRCVCRRTDSDGEMMILCDSCRNWLHIRCIGVNRHNIPPVYLCVFCKGSTPNLRGGRMREPQRANLLPTATTSPLAHKSQHRFR